MYNVCLAGCCLRLLSSVAGGLLDYFGYFCLLRGFWLEWFVCFEFTLDDRFELVGVSFAWLLDYGACGLGFPILLFAC